MRLCLQFIGIQFIVVNLHNTIENVNGVFNIPFLLGSKLNFKVSKSSIWSIRHFVYFSLIHSLQRFESVTKKIYIL